MFQVKHIGPGLVELSGRLDAAESERALESLSRITESLVADCAGLEYISSSGIGVIMQTYKRLHDGGLTLRLANVPPRIRSVFHYAGLAQLLGIE